MLQLQTGKQNVSVNKLFPFPLAKLEFMLVFDGTFEEGSCRWKSFVDEYYSLLFVIRVFNPILVLISIRDSVERMQYHHCCFCNSG